jgi:triosephosphate isomerase
MKPLIVANWKCNPSNFKDAKRLFTSVTKAIKNLKNIEIVICPPFIYLPYLIELSCYTLKPKVGAQDCFWEEKGAFTGEVSAKMLKNLGCDYVIVGHSERKKYFAETNEMVNKKLKAALKAKLKPILCIGETEKEREAGRTFKVLREQLKRALNRINIQSLRDLIIAYEPVWAIGTGKPCRIKEAMEANFFIKKIVKKIPILYGGSVNSKNASNYIKESKFQGLLVGGASLNPKEFIKIVKSCST